MSLLSELSPESGSTHRRKRLGRGARSGMGGTSTKGHKGQKSRTSPGIKPGFEGGQMPLHRRSPKWGFTNIFKKEFQVVNLVDLEARFDSGAEVTLETCYAKRIVRKKSVPLKVLGVGKLTKSLKVTTHAISKSAQKAVEEAKGSVSLIEKKQAQRKAS
jgi:large subunit ribosomal protein L15